MSYRSIHVLPKSTSGINKSIYRNTCIFWYFLINISFRASNINIANYIFFILGGSFYFIFKKNKKNWEERQLNDKKRLQYLQQGIYGIKETLIYNLQKFVIDKFNIPNSIVIKNIYHNSLISQYPRLIFEFFAILALLIVFVVYTKEIKIYQNCIRNRFNCCSFI